MAKTPIPANDDPLADRRIVKVSADALHRLTPFLSKRDDCSFFGHGRSALWGWRIEPCPTGGVLVIATCGTVAGVIHDPDGHASEPATILATKALRKAVAPPKERAVYYPGDYATIPLPDEFQPGQVVAMRLFVSVYDAKSSAKDAPQTDEEGYSLYTESSEEGNVWAGGYRLVSDYVDWRRAFAAWCPDKTTSSRARLDPRLFHAFRRIGIGPLDLSMPADENRPVLVQSAEQPDFVGLIMRGSLAIRSWRSQAFQRGSAPWLASLTVPPNALHPLQPQRHDRVRLRPAPQAEALQVRLWPAGRSPL